MILYTSDGCAYEGMSHETVTRLRTELGCETVYVTKEEYNQYIDAHRQIS